jgi:hypothetical protein
VVLLGVAPASGEGGAIGCNVRRNNHNCLKPRNQAHLRDAIKITARISQPTNRRY